MKQLSYYCLVLNYDIWDVIALEAQKSGMLGSQSQRWSWKNDQVQRFREFNCEEFPKHSSWRRMQRVACARSGAGGTLGTGLNGRGAFRTKTFIMFGIVFIAREHFRLGSGQDCYTERVHVQSP